MKLFVKIYIERTDDMVEKAYKEGNIPTIEEYVMRDVEAIHNLFEKLKGYII